MKAGTALIMVALAGCVSVPPDGSGPSAPLGGTAFAAGLAVRPLNVIEDSRCPIDVVCVWAGRLVVRTEIRGAGWRETRDLVLGKGEPIADGTLTLVSALPSRRADAAIEPQAYRFTFDFKGGI